MKTTKCFSLLLILLYLLSGCSDDDDYSDVDGLPPTISLASSTIQTEPGREFLIEAKIEDKDGLRSINLKNAAFQLDKTIDLTLDSIVYSFDLSYKFKTAKTLEGDNFPLEITTTDLGGRTTTETITVTMDGDFTSPVFTLAPDNDITVLLKSETRLNIKFTVEDDKALSIVYINIPELDYSQEVTTFTNSGKALVYDDPLTLPSKLATYNLEIRAVDKAGHETVKNSIITVSEMPDFPKMYLADVATVEELNSDVFGVPMRIERTAAYEYKANYYNEKAGTEIFFLPQKSDFTPICFGLDPVDNTKLTDDPSIAQPIVLTQANVYYEITFNVQTAAYNIKTYSIADAIDPVPHKFGSVSLDTWGDGGSWLQEFYFGYMTSSPKEVVKFKQDATNPHLYSLSAPLALEAGEKMNFIIHNWHSDGWWNYCTWRVDDSDEPETFGYYGNFKNPLWTKPNTTLDNWAKPTVKQTGSYKLYFDAHLGRGKLVRE
ncbi:hypothetical protein [Dysgonomonas macrotermitis]|uniref:Uncharacterized protein n=1 Tax=Dysgonomonas macrotermitis TaxID=1346286 RepID=A0A1M5JDM7_9BACT|nr:hypothetical protein [Dysgonomonas macrotermitis]SHG38370.1 hypothetical protein SAMN05444362_1238 [Dysgonomonas macrotermitis]